MGARGMGNLTSQERFKLIQSTQKELRSARSNETRKLNAFRKAEGSRQGMDWEAMGGRRSRKAQAEYAKRVRAVSKAENEYNEAVRRRERAERKLDRVRIKNRRSADEPLF